jgi:hypothetical protein
MEIHDHGQAQAQQPVAPPSPPPLLHPTPADAEAWSHDYRCRAKDITISLSQTNQKVRVTRYREAAAEASVNDLSRLNAALGELVQVRSVDVSCTDEFVTVNFLGLRKSPDGMGVNALLSANWVGSSLRQTWRSN